jgi:hypothetical protein
MFFVTELNGDIFSKVIVGYCLLYLTPYNLVVPLEVVDSSEMSVIFYRNTRHPVHETVTFCTCVVAELMTDIFKSETSLYIGCSWSFGGPKRCSPVKIR